MKPSPGKPNLLFISPTLPAVTGNGLAMRAGMVIEALAADFAVYLLVVPVHGIALDHIVEPPISE